MATSSFEQIREIAADILGVNATDLAPSSSPDVVDTWDSVQQLSLIMAVEQQFDLQFEPEEIESMKTLGAMATSVDAKRAAS